MYKFHIKQCKECGSDEISWENLLTNTNGIQDGKLRMHDIGIVYYLACNYCGETLAHATSSEVLSELNSLSAFK